MRRLIKLDRFSAWVLFATMLLYFISGYGMTKGIISSKLASDLHLSWLTYFVLISFVIHTGFAIHLAFKRWGIWKSYGKYLWFVFYFLFILGFVYIDRIYTRPVVFKTSTSSASSNSTTTSGNTNSLTTPSNNSGSASTTNNQSSTTNFTASTLAQYNGLGGQPAYAAVNGLVYDLSSLFINGFHHGYQAGQDLTQEFQSQHPESLLSGYQVVGTYTP
jgi:predicted heme/steroid binding protein